MSNMSNFIWFNLKMLTFIRIEVFGAMPDTL